MDTQVFKAKLIGTAPLLMHNGRLADPMDPATKALAAVSKGKAKDLEKTARAEFMGSLYLNDELEPCVPVDCILAAVIAGAKAYKNGKAAQAGVYDVAGMTSFPLVYKGPRDPEKLFDNPLFRDRRSVRVQMARIMRTRPMFRNWSLDIELEFDPTLIAEQDLTQSIERAGKAIGICDYRPRFGRFTVEVG